jgi:hypothetical protein
VAQFAAFVGSLYVGLNLFFRRALQSPAGGIAGSTGGHWFFDCLFQRASAGHGGYGHMYPRRFMLMCQHRQIMTGIFLLAAMTGLIFVRFSRRSRALYSAIHWSLRR